MAVPPLRILVAWRTGTPGSADALEFAAWLARTTPVQLRAVNCFPRTWGSTRGGAYRKWLHKETNSYRKEFGEARKAAGIPDEALAPSPATVATGSSEHVLLAEEAERFDAHLLIMGSGATAPKGRFLAGSTADTLLHFSPRPLGLTPRAVKLSKKGVRRVNFAFLADETQEDDPTLLLAAHYAASWGVPLRILVFSPSGLMESPIYDKMGLGDDQRERSLALLDRAWDRAAQVHEGLEISSDAATGFGWGGAVESVKWKKGDLLLLGSVSAGPLERVFVGSTTTEFLHHVPVPVIVNPLRRG